MIDRFEQDVQQRCIEKLAEEEVYQIPHRLTPTQTMVGRVVAPLLGASGGAYAGLVNALSRAVLSGGYGSRTTGPIMDRSLLGKSLGLGIPLGALFGSGLFELTKYLQERAIGELEERASRSGARRHYGQVIASIE